MGGKDETLFIHISHTFCSCCGLYIYANANCYTVNGARASAHINADTTNICTATNGGGNYPSAYDHAHGDALANPDTTDPHPTYGYPEPQSRSRSKCQRCS